MLECGEGQIRCGNEIGKISLAYFKGCSQVLRKMVTGWAGMVLKYLACVSILNSICTCENFQRLSKTRTVSHPAMMSIWGSASILLSFPIFFFVGNMRLQLVEYILKMKIPQFGVSPPI